ncbi:MAG: DUF1150 family protein [Magnetospirillum sp.]|nr:DUF1150 family protein [Magnetospirillum sp.]
MNSSPNGMPAMRDMSTTDFAAWGVPDVAFVKRVMVDDSEGWSIHAADGTQMGLAPTRDVAFAAIRQHDLEPVSVH